MASYLAITTSSPLYLNKNLRSPNGIKILENLKQELNHILELKNLTLLELIRKISLRLVYF